MNESAISASGYQIDQILGGRYRILSMLGKGGMGIVLRVEQIFLGKEFALKTIEKNLLSDVAVRRFQQEAKATFAVSHPNIISVNDFGLLDDETPFMVMEIVTGKTLARRLSETTSLSIEEAIPIFIQVCFGLAHAHESGIVHRDIKPSNIMLPDADQTNPGAVKILDFGIAKFTQSDSGESQALTKTGEIFGSPLYMSPEQCSGGKVDHRADVYSLGCVIFETLTGTPPFIGETALSTMMKHQSAPVPSLKEASLGGDFPKDLERIVQAMLAKNPNDRYQNLGVAAHDLSLIISGENAISGSEKIAISAPAIAAHKKTITLRKDSFAFAILVTAILSSLISTALVMSLMPTHDDEDKPSKPEISETAIPKDLGLFEKKIAQGACRFAINQDATDRSLEAFKDYTEAQEVDLKDCKISDKGIGFLKDSKILHLEVPGCNLTSVDNIAQLSYLRDLNLRGNKLNNACLEKLSHLKNLKSINIEENDDITENGILKLAAINSLDTVLISEDRFNQAAIERLKMKMPFCHFQGNGNKSRMEELRASSKIKKEIALLQHLYAIAKQTNPDHCGTAMYLNLIGDALVRQKKLAESESFYDKSIEILEKSGNVVDLPPLLRNAVNRAVIFKRPNQLIKLSNRTANLLYDTRYHDLQELVNDLFNLANVPRPTTDAADVVRYCQTAIDLTERFPTKLDTKLLPVFYEKAGWTYFAAGQKTKALPYFQKNIILLRPTKEQNLKPYARALIELAHTLPDFTARKPLYDEGLALLEKLNLPEDFNLKEHYCDACFLIAEHYDQVSDHKEAIKYLKKGLECLKQMRHVDECFRTNTFNRVLKVQTKKCSMLRNKL